MGLRATRVAGHDLAIVTTRVGPTALAFGARALALAFAFPTKEDFVDLVLGELGKEGKALGAPATALAFAAQEPVAGVLLEELTDLPSGSAHVTSPLSLGRTVLPEDLGIYLARRQVGEALVCVVDVELMVRRGVCVSAGVDVGRRRRRNLTRGWRSWISRRSSLRGARRGGRSPWVESLGVPGVLRRSLTFASVGSHASEASHGARRVAKSRRDVVRRVLYDVAYPAKHGSHAVELDLGRRVSVPVWLQQGHQL